MEMHSHFYMYHTLFSLRSRNTSYIRTVKYCVCLCIISSFLNEYLYVMNHNISLTTLSSKQMMDLSLCGTITIYNHPDFSQKLQNDHSTVYLDSFS